MTSSGITLLPGGRRLAAPSWVKPGNLAENCAFLAGRVNEAGLLFFESKASLEYTANDLPASLAALPLSWHVHLPGDLDWSAPDNAARVCLRLMDKLSFLDVRRAVLHPPLPCKTARFAFTGAAENAKIEQLSRFMEVWTASGRDARDIMLENLPGHDLGWLGCIAENLACSICFDLAHFLLNHDGDKLANMDWPDNLEAALKHMRMLHLCAPDPVMAPGGKQGCHAPLTALDSNKMELAGKLCRRVSKDATFMLELFQWEHIELSLPVLRSWLAVECT